MNKSSDRASKAPRPLVQQSIGQFLSRRSSRDLPKDEDEDEFNEIRNALEEDIIDEGGEGDEEGEEDEEGEDGDG
jgi:hypothetical protein